MKHSREILAIALPAIVSNITTPVLGLVDVAVTGHIGAAVYIGAIAVGGTMFNMLYWLFNFLRMGTSGLTAQAYGADDGNRCTLLFWRSVTVAVIIGACILALSQPIGGVILRFMDADNATQSLAATYFSICVIGAPAVMLSYALSGWFIGMQDSRTPMWMALLTNVANIVASITLVFGFGLKIEGVAAATCLAQWLGVLLGLVIAIKRYRIRRPDFRIVFERGPLAAFFRINTDIFFRTACLVAVTLWFTHAGASQSVDILAANALLLQLFMLFSFFIDGFAFAGEALAGKYHGRGSQTSLRTLVNELMRIGLYFAIIFTALYILGGEWFMAMLAEDKNVVSIAAAYLPWAAAVPLWGFAAFIFDGIFVGLTRTRAMLSAMAVAMLTFFCIYFALKSALGNNALWLAFCSYLAVRGLAEYMFYRRLKMPKV